MAEAVLGLDVKSLYEHALNMYRNGNIPYAAQLFEKLADSGHPFYSTFALVPLGDIYRKSSRREKEMQLYRRVTQLSDEEKLFLDPMYIGSCYLRTKDLEKARIWYMKAQELAAENPDVVASIAELSLLEGKSDEGIALAEKVAQRAEPKYQILGKYLKAIGLSLISKSDESAKELSWLGQYVISLANVPGDFTWDLRDTWNLVERMGDNVPKTELLIRVLDRTMPVAEFTRIWAETGVASG